MADFILEIFSEEIPATMQKNAQENLHKIVIDQFERNHIKFDLKNLNCFVGPCRIGFILSEISLTSKTQSQKKIGPKIDANEKAISGFMRSLGLENINQLQQIDGYYCYEIIANEVNTVEIIKNILPIILQKMQNSWPKIMRYNQGDSKILSKWIRPIRNILSMIDDQIIKFTFENLQSNNFTYTNHNLDEPLIINHAKDFLKILENNLIIIEPNKRKEIIINQIKAIKNQNNIELVVDEENSSLINEVVGLVEMPEMLIGKIDKCFLELPDEALILTLQNNQRYFCCRNIDGSLSDIFLFAINKKSDETFYKKIISDNEKLVRARLSDVEFFIDEDLKIPLIDRVNDLNNIIFQQDLGSVFQKAQRIKSLLKFLAVFIPHCDISLIDKISDLCKTDLTTKAVAELPELQGKIGSFYSLKQGYDDKIAIAIYEHYLPISNSQLPQTSLGIALALADKIDSIVGFFLINEKPTSSKDPYALRRSVLGIIRIAIKYDLALPIRILIEKSLNNYPIKLQKKFLQNDQFNFYDNKKKLIEEMVIFFVERLRSFLKDQESTRSDVLNLVIDEYLEDLEGHKLVDIIYLRKKIKFLNEFVSLESSKNIINLYKRSVNILIIEEKKDHCKYLGKPSILGLKSKYERILNLRIKQISTEFNKLILKAEFSKAFSLLVLLEIPLSNFFDNVTINDEDKNLRENRLLLLSRIRQLFSKIGDLSLINLS